MKKHIFQTYYTRQSDALKEFLFCRGDLERLHGAKISVIKMYRPFIFGDYRVEYEIVKEDKENA